MNLYRVKPAGLFNPSEIVAAETWHIKSGSLMFSVDDKVTLVFGPNHWKRVDTVARDVELNEAGMI